MAPQSNKNKLYHCGNHVPMHFALEEQKKEFSESLGCIKWRPSKKDGDPKKPKVNVTVTWICGNHKKHIAESTEEQKELQETKGCMNWIPLVG